METWKGLIIFPRGFVILIICIVIQLILDVILLYKLYKAEEKNKVLKKILKLIGVNLSKIDLTKSDLLKFNSPKSDWANVCDKLEENRKQNYGLSERNENKNPSK